MPVYKFTFGSQFVGHDAQVVDADTRVEVAGSPFTIEADGTGGVVSATLDEGNYWAEASNALLALGGSRTTGTLDIIASIAAGGGSSSEAVSRGTLYLKASVVDADASSETWADGSGAPFALVLDEDKQGDTPIPGWADEDGGVYSITEGGTYIGQIAGVGTVTFDEIPTLAYIDMYSNELSGVNYGWSSDGNENSEAFTPALENDLLFGVTDANTAISIDPDIVPLALPGLVGDNYGDTTGSPVVSLTAKLSITKLGSGARYTEADFE